MPILPKEVDIYPDDLLQCPSEDPWWVTYTLSRREKELMRQLRRMQIGFYCPLIPKRNRSPNGRIRTSHVPLFAGYVFVQADAELRQQALTSNCISRTIPVPDPAELVADLCQIQRWILCCAILLSSLAFSACYTPDEARLAEINDLLDTCMRHQRDWSTTSPEARVPSAPHNP